MEEVFGYPPEDLGGGPDAWRENVHPEDLPNVVEGFRELASTSYATREFRYRHADGSWRWSRAETRATPAESGEELDVIGFLIDVSERKELEQRLQQSQKMEAVGRLAGGVAHDFNNILTAITGYVELALAEIPGGSPVHEDLQEVRRAADRAAALTRQLLAFSRRQVLQPETLDLNRVVVDMEKMLRRVIGEDVDLQTRLAEGPEKVRIDPGQLEQVILNLVVNARDAMPRGGNLVLATRALELQAAFERSGARVPPGKWVVLDVVDSGTGMDEATRERIFEPFFTTKAKGEGTGLGLATVYGIVKQSDGFVFVDSSPGEGTRFSIYLPRVEAEEE